MEKSMKKVADALLKAGQKNVPEDTRLVYVNESEYDYLTRRSGRGEPDPDTGIEHFDEGGDGTGFGSDEGAGSTGTEAGGDAFSNGTDGTGSEGWDIGGAVDPNSTDPNVESAGVMAGTRGAQTAEEETTSQAGGKAGGGVSADDAARANAEYESIYGTEDAFGDPYTGAGAINSAYDAYVSDFTNAGRAGQIIGTLFDVARSGRQGASLGPLGVAVAGVLGGLRGGTGDALGQAGRDSVADALVSGAWGSGYGAPGEDSGGGSDEAYMGGSPTFSESGGGLMAPPFSGAGGGQVVRPVWNDYVPMVPIAPSAPGTPTAPPTAQQPAFSPAILSALEASGMPADAIDYLMHQEKEKQIVEAMRKQAEKQPATASQIPRLEDYLARRA